MSRYSGKQLPKIEHGIPIPEGGAKGRWERLFSEMGIGDSIRGSYSTLRASGGRYQKAHPGWEFTVRQVDNVDARLWCTGVPSDQEKP